MNLRALTLTTVLAFAFACSTHNTTLLQRDAGRQVIYRISEAQAFDIARGAFSELLGDRKLFDIQGARRGYWTSYRFGIDHYSMRVLVIPAVGADAAGREVHGYWFDVSGRGSALISGHLKNKELYEHIREAADATGTAVAVSNLRAGSYESDGSAYLAQGRKGGVGIRGSQPSASAGPALPGSADRLRELKRMRDDGLISAEEYETKRRAVLDRM